MSSNERTETNGSGGLVRKLIAALDAVPADPGYTPDRQRQQAVFTRLPDTLMLELKAHRYASDREQRFHEERLGLPHAEQDERMVMRGKVFELLVSADPAIHVPSQAGEELLALLHGPNRFNLAQTLGYPRNPDLAFLVVEEKDGGLIIKAAGECKLGRLNARALKQLDGGFLQGFTKAMEVINHRSDLSSYGLTELSRIQQAARSQPFLRLAPDFHLRLVVPANRDTRDTDNLLKTEELSPAERERFHELLGHDGTVTVVKAAFSIAEVATIAHALLDDR